MADGDRRGVAWLAHMVRVSPVPVPWRDVVRVAVSVPVPLAVGLLLERVTGSGHALAAGVFASIGALVAAIASRAGPLRERLRRTTAGVVCGAVGFVVGRYAATGGGWRPVLVIAALAGIAGLVSAVNANVSFGSLQLLIYVAIGSGMASPLPEGAEIGLFFAGGGWATLITLVRVGTDPVDPDRVAVGAVFTATGELLAASGTGTNDEVRRALTGTLNRAYDQVIASRSHSPGRSRRLAELAGILNSTAPLVEGAVALYRAAEPADPRDVHAVDTLAAAVAGDHELTGRQPPPATTGSPAAQAVRNGTHLAWTAVADPEKRHGAVVVAVDRSWRARLRDLADQTVANPDSRAFAVRLALCMSIAEILRQNLPIPRPYWVLLTVAIVLKPDFGSVFARAVQRTVGTVLGVLLGALLLTVLPHNGWMLVPMAVVAGAVPWALAANYGLVAVFLTPLVLILLDLASRGGSELVAARVVDTLVGCAIVLVFGYLLWPQTWRAPLDQALRATVLTLDGFVEAAFTGDPTSRRRARRRTFRALTDLQTQLQRRLAEPPPVSTRAAAWWPVIVQLERASEAVVEAVVAIRSGQPPPDPAQVAVLRRAIRQLDDDVDARRPPSDTAILADGVLAPIVEEIDTARLLLHEAVGGHRAPAA